MTPELGSSRWLLAQALEGGRGSVPGVVVSRLIEDVTPGRACRRVSQRLQVHALELEGEEEVPAQGVRVGFLPLGETRLELLEPTGPDSPIARHLERRGPGLHHICIRVDDIRAAMDRLSSEGYRLLSDEPQQGAHGCQVCFVHPKSAGGVLIELSQPG